MPPLAPQRLFLNEDANHFVYSRPPEQLTPEGVDALVDGYVEGTQVADLVFNPNASRSAIPSRVKQPFWEGYDPAAGDDQPYFAATREGREILHRTNRAWLLLQERGIDLYHRWIDRTRALGARAWLSVRMNDLHNVDEPGHAFHDRLFREHPEYRRIPWREYEWQGDRALDYAHAAVRDHHLAYIRECVAGFDFDGLEIDWMRAPWCFRPGREDEGRDITRGMMAEVRRALHAREKEVGHPIRLLARVPARPEASFRLGFDAAEWARSGLIDVLVPTPDFGATDFDIPVELWKGLLAGTGVSLAPGLEITLLPFPFAPFGLATAETTRGAAAGLLARGADCLYLFNYMDAAASHPLGVDGLRTILSEVGSLDTLAGKARRHVMTYPTPAYPGERLGGGCVLPYRLSRYGYRPTAEFRLPTGPAPDTSQEITLRLGLEAADAPPDRGTTVQAMGRSIRYGMGPPDPAAARGLVVRLDGQACPFAGELPPDGKPLGPTHAFRVPEGVLRRGDNVFEVSNPSETPLTVVWVEARVGEASQ